MLPEEKALFATRHAMQEQLRAVQREHPEGGQPWVDTVAQWQSANASAMANAEEAVEKRSDAMKSRTISRLQEPQKLPTSSSQNMPKAQAEAEEHLAAARQLQLTLLQTAKSSPEEKRAALEQWKSNYGTKLDQGKHDAEEEAKQMTAVMEAKKRAAQTASPTAQ